jgi:ABC-type Mn2+/Zn2+ transport system permease subunit
VVQPFLTATPLDPSAMVCVIAFAVSIPLLAALLVLNRQEEFRRRASKSPFVGVAKAVAQGSAVVGITAAFWHTDRPSATSAAFGSLVVQRDLFRSDGVRVV